MTDYVAVKTAEYNDPNAVNPNHPEIMGWVMRVTTHSNAETGDSYDTFEFIYPMANAVVIPSLTGKGKGTPYGDRPLTSINLQGESLKKISIKLGFSELLNQSPKDGTFTFPVTPERITATFPHAHWTPITIGVGEILIPGVSMLESIEWTSFFPKVWDSDYCVASAPGEEENWSINDQDEYQGNLEPSRAIINLIETQRLSLVCKLIVGGGIWADDVVIDNFSYSHMPGELDDYEYNIRFKRARIPKITTIATPVPTTPDKDDWRLGDGTNSNGVAIEELAMETIVPDERINEGENRGGNNLTNLGILAPYNWRTPVTPTGGGIEVIEAE
jgi:hypothetical protein